MSSFPKKFPTRTDYENVLQNPSQFLNDSDLKKCVVLNKKNGLPRGFSGGFAVVYKVSISGHTKALRFFTHYTPDSEVRYFQLNKFFSNLKSDYFVEFEFIRDGVTVAGISHPVIKMGWIDGSELGDYIKDHIDDPEALKSLLLQICDLFDFLKQNRIAHGDLSHTNIWIENGGIIRLIDYDGLYCDATKGYPSLETGLPHYQHPERELNAYGVSSDNFSMWIISLSLVILINDRKFLKGQDCIVFDFNDYRSPIHSQVLQELKSHSDTVVRRCGELVESMIGMPFSSIPSFSSADMMKMVNFDTIQTIKNPKNIDWRSSHGRGNIPKPDIVVEKYATRDWRKIVKKSLRRGIHCWCLTATACLKRQ